ncbi:serine/threonine-protein kinase Nek1-like [Pelobates fuscus]|uniref:serine/threonine-protein kinase Nek1-like n=1 Tax=Pelobates fuscus TaxID=191477 RepID=UPI002FE4A465
MQKVNPVEERRKMVEDAGKKKRLDLRQLEKEKRQMSLLKAEQMRRVEKEWMDRINQGRQQGCRNVIGTGGSCEMKMQIEHIKAVEERAVKLKASSEYSDQASRAAVKPEAPNGPSPHVAFPFGDAMKKEMKRFEEVSKQAIANKHRHAAAEKARQVEMFQQRRREVIERDKILKAQVNARAAVLKEELERKRREANERRIRAWEEQHLAARWFRNPNLPFNAAQPGSPRHASASPHGLLVRLQHPAESNTPAISMKWQAHVPPVIPLSQLTLTDDTVIASQILMVEGGDIKLDSGEPRRPVWSNSPGEAFLRIPGEAKLQMQTERLQLTNKPHPEKEDVAEQNQHLRDHKVIDVSPVDRDNVGVSDEQKTEQPRGSPQQEIKPTVIMSVSKAADLSHEDPEDMETEDVKPSKITDGKQRPVHVTHVWNEQSEDVAAAICDIELSKEEAKLDSEHDEVAENVGDSTALFKKVPLPRYTMTSNFSAQSFIDVPDVADVQGGDPLKIGDIEDDPTQKADHSDSEDTMFGETDRDLHELQASMEQLLRGETIEIYCHDEETVMTMKPLEENKLETTKFTINGEEQKGEEEEDEEEHENLPGSESDINKEWHSDDSSEDFATECDNGDSVFGHLEELRLKLEQEIGFDKFIEVYKKIKANHEDESIDTCSIVVQQILGFEHQHLYHTIFRLVIADGAYQEDNDE